MKKALWRILLCTMVLTIVLGGASVFAEENLFVWDDSFDGFYMQSKDEEPGVFVNGDSGISSGSETFYLPGLTKNFTFAGHIKILQIGSYPYNGVRLIIGSSLSGSCQLLITKSWAVRFDFNRNNLGDKMWNTELRLNEGTEFDFEVTRRGTRISLKIDGVALGALDIEEDLDMFDESGDYNLGFAANDCRFEVSNIRVECPDIEITPEPTAESTPSASPEATSSPTEDTQETATAQGTPSASATAQGQNQDNKDEETNNKNEEKDSSISPVVIVACAVAVVAVAACVIVLVRRKKTGK